MLFSQIIDISLSNQYKYFLLITMNFCKFLSDFFISFYCCSRTFYINSVFKKTTHLNRHFQSTLVLFALNTVNSPREKCPCVVSGKLEKGRLCRHIRLIHITVTDLVDYSRSITYPQSSLDPPAQKKSN